MSIVAIITGDMVGSGNIHPRVREKLFEDTRFFLKGLQNKFLSSYETYRGDSLQCATLSPDLALRVAIIIRAFFRSYKPPSEDRNMPKDKIQQPSRGYFSSEYDIRLAIGLGETEFMKEKLSASDGDAFRRSGNALDKLMKSNQRLAIHTHKQEFDQQNEPALLLLDAVMQKWTQTQAELVLYKLQDKKEEQIAHDLNISQSAVNQRTKTSQWHAIEKMVIQFEKTVKSWMI